MAKKQNTVKQRNPEAMALATGKYRNAVMRDRTKYSRKQKHKNKNKEY